jgi:hypothetical protein
MRLAHMKPSELAKRRARIASDVDLIASGWRPSAQMLLTAPRIEAWHELPHPSGGDPCLAGDVTGHPALGDGLQITSPIVAYGPGWIRTESRFYSVGAKATETLEARVQRERQRSIAEGLGR